MSKIDDNRTSASSAPARRSGVGEAWEDDVRAAFAELHAPDELKTSTLAAIEARRREDAGARRPEASPRKRGFKVLRRALAAAACVVALAAGVMGVSLYMKPAAYVGVDVNPSLELSVNAFGMVVGADALNDDGAAVLEDVSLANKAYADALDELLASDSMAPYLQGSPYVEVSVTASDDALAEELDQASAASLSAAGCAGGCSRVDEETREAAHHAGMGVGRYAAAQELLALDPALTLDDCAHMTMRELRDRIDACHDGSEEDEDGMQHGLGQDGYSRNAAAGSSASADAQGQQSAHGHRHGQSE